MFENTVVTNVKFGKGIIISLEETPEIYSHMVVDFNGVTKKFGYPICFEKHFTTENEELRERASRELHIYTTLEEARKKAKIRAILASHNLLDEEEKEAC